MRLSRTLPYRKAAAWKPSTLPLCIFTGQRQLELRKILGFHPTFSRHGIAQILSALALLIWLDEKVGVHPTFSRHGIAQSLSALASSFGLTKRLLQPAWWQGNLRRQSSVSPSPALYMMARCLPADGALSSAVINVVHGRGQRAEPVFATDFPLEAMERRGEEADNSVPSSSFGHLRASKGGGGVSICEILLIFAVRHFTQCIE